VTKPTLLYCAALGPQAADLSHTGAVAHFLSAYFHVVVLSGAGPPETLASADGVEFRHVTTAASDLTRTRRPGPAALFRAYLELDPHVLLIEDFPWQHDHEDLLENVLEPIAVSGMARPEGRPLIVCSISDVVGQISRDPDARRRLAETLSHRFDLVLVHSDPAFARLEELLPGQRLRTALHHTGFVVAEETRRRRTDRAGVRVPRRQVVVSAGSGPGAATLHRVACAAQPLLWTAGRLEMTITLSARLPAADRAALTRAAHDVPGLTLAASEAGASEAGGINSAQHAACMVCDGSFAAVSDVLVSATPALVVPDPGPDHAVQHERGRRLVQVGGGRMLPHRQLNPASFASSVQQLACLAPALQRMQLNGARVTAELIREHAASAAAPVSAV
jgi:predicted glycosyltransferase